MAAAGLGYDLSTSTYSPDGRLYQIEYANKAVEQGGTIVALRCKDGVVMALENLQPKKLLVPNTNKRAQTIDTHLGIACCGLLSDSRRIGNICTEESSRFHDTYRVEAPTAEIAERLANYKQMYTLYSSVRPFGVSTALIGWDAPADPARITEGKPQLYNVEVSGAFAGYKGFAAGKGRVLARTEMEKLDLDNLSAKEGLIEAVRILLATQADLKTPDLEIEVTWISPETNYEHQHLATEHKDEIERIAREALQEDVEMDD